MTGVQCLTVSYYALLGPPHPPQSESTGTASFTLYGPAGGGTNLTGFHFETKVSGADAREACAVSKELKTAGRHFFTRIVMPC